jgi:predicted DNA-binding transcriptional regulator AlpA
MSTKSPIRLLRLEEVRQRTGLSRSAVYSDEMLSRARVKISRRAVGFIEHEVASWVAARIAARDAARPRRKRA